MKRKIVLWMVIGALFLAVLFMVFKAGTGASVSILANMANAGASPSAMVGGC